MEVDKQMCPGTGGSVGENHEDKHGHPVSEALHEYDVGVIFTNEFFRE